MTHSQNSCTWCGRWYDLLSCVRCKRMLCGPCMLMHSEESHPVTVREELHLTTKALDILLQIAQEYPHEHHTRDDS
jgi:hypothetical protein